MTTKSKKSKKTKMVPGRKVPVITHGELVTASEWAKAHGTRLSAKLRTLMAEHGELTRRRVELLREQNQRLRQQLDEAFVVMREKLEESEKLRQETSDRATGYHNQAVKAMELAEIRYQNAVFGRRCAKVMQFIVVQRPDHASETRDGRREEFVTDIYTLDGQLVATGGSLHGGEWTAFGKDHGKLDLFRRS
jgi:hypothetical protein